MISPIATHVDRLSLSVAPVQSLYGKEKLGIGTGFFYRFQSAPHFITNWHNVSARIPQTGQPIASDGVVPDSICIKFQDAPKKHSEGQSSVSLTRTRMISLPGLVDFKGPWIMHRIGQMIDLIAINLGLQNSIICINDFEFVEDPHFEAGQEAFILGYPRGLQPTGILPIWKRASIATEPAVLPNGEPWILVDAATREGMSGSPVIATAIDRQAAAALRNPLGPDTPIILKPGRAPVGVYSGRMGLADALEAQLGKVWLWSCIDTMLNDPRPAGFEIF